MQDKYTNAFMGYGPEDTNFCLELTQNYGVDSYNLGTGFGHFELALPDVYKTTESIKSAGRSTFILLPFFICFSNKQSPAMSLFHVRG